MCHAILFSDKYLFCFKVRKWEQGRIPQMMLYQQCLSPMIRSPASYAPSAPSLLSGCLVQNMALQKNKGKREESSASRWRRLTHKQHKHHDGFSITRSFLLYYRIHLYINMIAAKQQQLIINIILPIPIPLDRH